MLQENLIYPVPCAVGSSPIAFSCSLLATISYTSLMLVVLLLWRLIYENTQESFKIFMSILPLIAVMFDWIH